MLSTQHKLQASAVSYNKQILPVQESKLDCVGGIRVEYLLQG